MTHITHLQIPRKLIEKFWFFIFNHRGGCWGYGVFGFWIHAEATISNISQGSFFRNIFAQIIMYCYNFSSFFFAIFCEKLAIESGGVAWH